MSDGIMLTIGDDGEATLYDDTYDITIHCESKEEQDEVRKALENIPHWIPVTERPPEVGADILFCDIDGDVYAGHRTRYGDFYPDFSGDKIKNVVAWMQKPEPYKEVTK